MELEASMICSTFLRRNICRRLIPCLYSMAITQVAIWKESSTRLHHGSWKRSIKDKFKIEDRCSQRTWVCTSKSWTLRESSSSSSRRAQLAENSTLKTCRVYQRIAAKTYRSYFTQWTLAAWRPKMPKKVFLNWLQFQTFRWLCRLIIWEPQDSGMTRTLTSSTFTRFRWTPSCHTIKNLSISLLSLVSRMTTKNLELLSSSSPWLERNRR